MVCSCCFILLWSCSYVQLASVVCCQLLSLEFTKSAVKALLMIPSNYLSFIMESLTYGICAMHVPQICLKLVPKRNRAVCLDISLVASLLYVYHTQQAFLPELFPVSLQVCWTWSGIKKPKVINIWNLHHYCTLLTNTQPEFFSTWTGHCETDSSLQTH